LVGIPPYGFPEPLRSKILKGRDRIEGRAGEQVQIDDILYKIFFKYYFIDSYFLLIFEKIKQDFIAKYGEVTDCDVMSYVMFTKVLEEFLEFKHKFGLVECLDTRGFLLVRV
jgi:pyruvate carboxylase